MLYQKTDVDEQDPDHDGHGEVGTYVNPQSPEDDLQLDEEEERRKDKDETLVVVPEFLVIFPVGIDAGKNREIVPKSGSPSPRFCQSGPDKGSFSPGDLPGFFLKAIEIGSEEQAHHFLVALRYPHRPSFMESMAKHGLFFRAGGINGMPVNDSEI